MKTTLSIIGIASLALVGLSTEAIAQGPYSIRPEQCLASLPLTFQQERQIDGLRAFAFQESHRLRVQIDRAEAELRILTLRLRPHRIAIARKESELQILRGREQSVWATYRLQVQSVLGPAQRIAMSRCSSRPGPVPIAVSPTWTVRSLPVTYAHVPSPRPMSRR